MKLAHEFSREEINQKIPYVMIYEGYEQVLRGGKVAREYRKAFTTEEKKCVFKWKNKFRLWYLVKGVPENVLLTQDDLKLIDKMALFFSSI